MEYLKQFSIIIIVTFVGVVLSYTLPLPIPASIYGLLILLFLLLSGILKLESVKDISKLLIKLMPIMFIPAGVGLVTVRNKLSPILVPVGIITFLTTFIVMIISGKFTEIIIRKNPDNKG